MFKSGWWHKVSHFEYWPWYIFYLPLVPFVLWQLLRFRQLNFYAYSNPGIADGGLQGESKIDILNAIPNKYLPITLYFEAKVSTDEILHQLHKAGLTYPIIAKPNVGERGKDVEKITSESQLKSYVAEHNESFLIQEFIGFEYEFGVFYARIPGEDHGKVTSITGKGNLQVVGDGSSNVRTLMQQEYRSQFQLPRFEEQHPEELNKIPAKGETVVLEPIGNHSRGTTFINNNNLITPEVHKCFDAIAKPIDGFYYGRFDLKVKSIEDLSTGENLKIMELNGVSSEPGHVYDPNYKLWAAYKDILQHWSIAVKIAEKNLHLISNLKKGIAN